MQGRVTRVSGRQCLVEAEGCVWQCKVRGRLKAGARRTTVPIAVGDQVQIEVTGPDSGVIETVLPRRSWIARAASGGRPYQQVIAANLDRLIIVVAVAQPEVRTGFIDRSLVAAHSGQVEPLVCFNKIDLAPAFAAGPIPQVYADLGYQTLFVSAATGEGMDGLEAAVKGRMAAFLGHSGVGKSSLLNRLDRQLDLPTRQLMERHDRGRHTTTAVQLYRIRGGLLADTPGIKELHPWGLAKEGLVGYFSEMAPLAAACHFRNCTHLHEPGCAVLAAVQAGGIADFRHQSYRRIMESL